MLVLCSPRPRKSRKLKDAAAPGDAAGHGDIPLEAHDANAAIHGVDSASFANPGQSAVRIDALR